MQATMQTTSTTNTTNTTTNTAPASTAQKWVGRVISGVAALFMLFDAAVKVARVPAAVEASAPLGIAAALLPGIGLLALISVALYVLPRTAVLGAILMTGYLGGAVATLVRVGSPSASLLLPVILGAMFWGGLLLRQPRLRALFR